MRLRPSELAEHGYEITAALNHKDLIPFIKDGLKLKTRASFYYRLMNGVLFGIIIGIGIYYALDDNLSFEAFFSHLGSGAALAFLLIPFHEYLHVLAYRYVGAQNTSYDANWKKFYFMALADRFVADRKEFRLVALTPFVVITLLGVMVLPFVGSLWAISILGLITLHTAFCSGDFGLLSFMEFNKNKDPLTYDDVKNGISYFLMKSSKDRIAEEN